MSDRAVAYIDGGARGNPGPAGYGVRVEDEDATLIEELHGGIGTATNNVAEYRGLLAALAYFTEHGYQDVVIRSDSLLLTKQMRGEYKVKNAGLQPLHREARALVARLDTVRFEHVRREQNREADRLANLAMDAEQGKPVAAARQATAARKPSPHRPAPLPLSGAADREGAVRSGSSVPATPRTSTKTSAKKTSAAKTSGTGAAPTEGRTEAAGVIALGADIESIARVEGLARRYGQRFLRRVFTAQELEYCAQRRASARHLAARFCAKEATMKALGTGLSLGVAWRDVEVVRTDGAPALRLRGRAATRLAALGAARALVTLSHAGDLASAHVLLLDR